MQLYLVRHGQSLINIPGASQDKPSVDLGLTSEGHEQSTQLAGWLKTYVPTPDVIFASDMRRAQETAEYVGNVYQQALVLDTRLREIGNNYANHQPIPAESLPRTYTALSKFTAPYEPVALDVESSESWANFRHRVSDFVEQLLPVWQGKTVMAVCHGGTINAVIDHVMNISLWRRCDIRCQYTSITLLHYRGKQDAEPWHLAYLGLHHHLLPSLSS
jgi:2,3-bisphosphoglycerate-dependent phosphoglycerate mutase